MGYETGIYGGFVQFQDMEEKSTYIFKLFDCIHILFSAIG